MTCLPATSMNTHYSGSVYIHIDVPSNIVVVLTDHCHGGPHDRGREGGNGELEGFAEEGPVEGAGEEGEGQGGGYRHHHRDGEGPVGRDGTGGGWVVGRPLPVYFRRLSTSSPLSRTHSITSPFEMRMAWARARGRNMVEARAGHGAVGRLW